MKLARNHIITAAAVFTILVSSVVIIGWFFDIGLFKSILDSYISMKFNTAVCFLITGILLLKLEKKKVRVAEDFFVLILIVSSVLTLSEYIFNYNLGIDEFLWKEGTGTPNTFFPGRPSAASALNFLFISLLFILIRIKRGYIISFVLFSICCLIGVFSFISYLFGIENMIGVGSLTTLALHTSILFIVICVGISQTNYFDEIAGTFKHKLLIGFLGIAIAFIVIFYLDNKNDEQFIDIAKHKANTEMALSVSDDILFMLSKAESGVRGFLVTENKEILNTADSIRIYIYSKLGQLKSLTADTKEKENRIDSLSILISNRFQLFDKELLAKSFKDDPQIRNYISESVALTYKIISVIAQVKSDQRKYLTAQENEHEKRISGSDRTIYFFAFCLFWILITLLVFIFRNTNARVKAEEEARQLSLSLERHIKIRTNELISTRDQFRFTLDNMMEGVQIISFDWKFIYVNDSMLKQIKYTREGLIGFSVKDKYQDFELTEVYKACKHCFEERASLNIEDKFVYDDGSVKYFECSIQPVPEGVFILSVDITDRKMALEKIKANEDKYRAVIDNSLFAIILARPGEKPFQCNNATLKMFEYTEEEFMNLTREQLLDFSDPKLVQQLKDRDIKGSSRGECMGIKKNGQKFSCEVTSVIFKDSNGDNMTCAMIADISQRKIAEEKLLYANEELRKLTLHLNTVREEERQKLSREIQEELGQLASAIKMDIDWLNLNITDSDVRVKARMKNALYVLQLMIDSTRKIASYLRPGMIDELGLNATLKWQCEDFQKINNIPCVFTEDYDDSQLPSNVRTELFRICQEALNNIVRHAQATKVNVSIRKADFGVEISVKDDGKGFDSSNRNNDLGLIAIRERVHSILGELIIESEPGKGTNIKVRVPVH